MRNLILAAAAAPALILTLAASPALSAGLEIDVTGQASGTITIDLFEDVAPLHAAQITALAAAGAYDGVVFHRVIDGFMAQTGDLSRGRASVADLPSLPLEASDLTFARGVVGMARNPSNRDSATSQFFIMFADGPYLDGDYTVVGQVVSGLDVLDDIARGEPPTNPDVMAQVRVTD